MLRRRKAAGRSFDLLDKYNWYVPDWKGVLKVALLFVLGFFIAQAVGVVFMFALGQDAFTTYGNLIVYPIMFIPAMMYCSRKSLNNAVFESGYAIDSNNFSPLGAVECSLVAAVAVIAVAFVVEPVIYLLPEMSEVWKKALEALMDGPLWVTLLSVSVFAPFFEEWLCRGVVLRGLLHTTKPVWAIILSSLFFAIIHMNPWQGIPAFILGCLFGYVYYKTGSLKLTMLMHFVNNTISACLGKVEAFKDMETYYDAVPDHRIYFIMYGAMVIISVLAILKFKKVELKSAEGNCDYIAAAEDSSEQVQ